MSHSGSIRHSQLIERIKLMLIADAPEESFYQLNHNNQLWGKEFTKVSGPQVCPCGHSAVSMGTEVLIRHKKQKAGQNCPAFCCFLVGSHQKFVPGRRCGHDFRSTQTNIT